MAFFLLSNLSLSLSPSLNPLSKPKLNNRIRCGPRSNRGPLLKGRTLSSEAIQAIQILKRHRSNYNPSSPSLSNTLSRLIKSDLIAAFKELLRQEELDLAVRVFKEVRDEYGCDLAAYADLVLALDKGKRGYEIDVLIGELEVEDREREERGRRGSTLSPPDSLRHDLDENEKGYLSPPGSFRYEIDENEKAYSSRMSEHGSFGENERSYNSIPSFTGLDDRRGLVRLMKALIAAGRGESTVRVYEMMKRSGWGSDRTVEDEYLGRVLERGFKRFGEERLAKEVRDLFGGVLEKERV